MNTDALHAGCPILRAAKGGGPPRGPQHGSVPHPFLRKEWGTRKKRTTGNFYGRRRTPANCRARGAALLVCVFTMLIISSLVIFALNIQTTEMAVARNTLDLSKALYLADAGLQHALGMFRADRTWRTGFPSPGVEYPANSGNFYVVTVVDGSGREVIVTSTGSSGGLSKTVRATIALP